MFAPTLLSGRLCVRDPKDQDQSISFSRHRELIKVMNTTKHIIYLLVVCLVLSTLGSCDTEPSIHILLIGNSFTFFNGGLDKGLKGLTPAAETECIAVGGYSLESHWDNGSALKRIQETKWDYVVLQEQSQIPVINQKLFFEFARKFDEEIRRSGAKTILLMTWERPDSRQLGITTEALAAAYTDLGKQLGARVAPAGTAFARSLHHRPELALYRQDGHPTIEGTYLASCVLYHTIFGQSPVGNPYSEPSIPDDTRDFLQRAAVDSLGS